MKAKGIRRQAEALIFTMLALGVLISAPAAAAEKAEKPKAAQLSLAITAQKEVEKKKDGKTVIEYVSAEKAGKGETLVYTITYTNKTAAPVKSVSVVDPIPAGTVYIPGTAAGKDTEITFSIDGGKTYLKAPVKYKAKKADGTGEEKLASPDMYTHIKWLIKRTVQPGKSGVVSFKIKIK
ncbi:MAG: hypothetical protein WCX65_11325 [bacterium]